MHVSLIVLLWLLACLLALLRGGPTERMGAILLVLVMALTMVLRPLAPATLDRLDPSACLTDTLALAACLAFALTTTQRWPLWFCAAQLVAVQGHLLRYALPGMLPAAYGALTRGPSYVQCLTLLFAVLAHARAQNAVQPEKGRGG